MYGVNSICHGNREQYRRKKQYSRSSVKKTSDKEEKDIHK